MLTAEQAEGIAIACGIKARAIREIKDSTEGDERAAALLVAAGQSATMTLAEARSLVDTAWASAPRDADGDVESNVALRLANATNMLKGA